MPSEKCLFSVIVPCFNVEMYIDRCVKSLLDQTLDHDKYEIILINDASTDHTLNKLLQWESKFPNIISVISYEENLRQGGARNQGMFIAKGEYISFVDADDFVNCNLYSILSDVIAIQQFDEIIFKSEKVCDQDLAKNEYQKKSQIFEFDESKVYNHKKLGSFFDYQISDYGKNGILTTHSHVYRRAFIEEHELFFPEKVSYEDNYFGKIVPLFIQNTYIVDNVLYYYYTNPTSTTSVLNSVRHLDRISIELAVLDRYRELGAFDLFYNKLEWSFIEFFYLNTLYVLFTKFSVIPNIYNFLRDKVYENFPNFAKNPQVKNQKGRRKLLIDLLISKKSLNLDDFKELQKAYLNSLITDMEKENQKQN